MTCCRALEKWLLTALLLRPTGRQAKSQEPGNLVPGHFWSKIWTFFRNQRFKEINWKF